MNHPYRPAAVTNHPIRTMRRFAVGAHLEKVSMLMGSSVVSAGQVAWVLRPCAGATDRLTAGSRVLGGLRATCGTERAEKQRDPSGGLVTPRPDRPTSFASAKPTSAGVLADMNVGQDPRTEQK